MHRFFYSFFSVIFLLMHISASYGWNGTGHQLIAELALTQLSKNEQARLRYYNQSYQMGFQPKTLRLAAVWLDWLRCREASCSAFRKYHYIDYPYAVDHRPSVQPDQKNAVFAVKQALNVLQNPHSTSEEKGLQLRILLHVVGDLHQPMHAVRLYSARFPAGDRGGNAYLLGKNHVAKNLHAYWDRGGGYLIKKSLQRRRGFKRAVRHLKKRYPCTLASERLDPMVWAKESYHLARDEAYQIGFEAKPSLTYQKNVRKLTAERISLAACRLGQLLKTIA